MERVCVFFYQNPFYLCIFYPEECEAPSRPKGKGLGLILESAHSNGNFCGVGGWVFVLDVTRGLKPRKLD